MKSKLGLSKILMYSFAALAVLTIAVSGFAIYSLSRLGGTVEELVSVRQQQSVLAADVVFEMGNVQSLQRGMILRAYMKDQSTITKYDGDVQASFGRTGESIKEYRRLSTAPEERSLADDLEHKLQAVTQAYPEVLAAVRAGQAEEATQAQANRVNPAIKAAADVAATIKKRAGDLSATAGSSAAAQVTTSRLVAIVLGLIAACVAAASVVMAMRMLRDVVRTVEVLQQGAEQVASAANQLSSTSQSLSQGSTEQAASLEETSASMEEMASMARQNAENADHVVKLMNETEQAAASSNTALNNMVKAMTDIRTSSVSVSKIIRTIDEIAFQTNILALNAAVEAARAGEAGMGFAVVADEVRNLAQRSAQAAKDTSTLIEEAINNANAGESTVSQVVSGMTAVTEGVGKARTLVQEVSGASRQQMQGIEQVAQAVTQMEKVTQQSAASAEESAAAAEELDGQADTTRSEIVHLQILVNGEQRDTRSARPRLAPSKKTSAEILPMPEPREQWGTYHSGDKTSAAHARVA